MSGVTSRVVISAFLLLVGAAIIIPLAIDVDSASATVAAWPE